MFRFVVVDPVAYYGEALRREPDCEGVRVLTVYPGGTSTLMLESSTAGAEAASEYEAPVAVADATIQAIGEGSITVARVPASGVAR